jgi:glycosyltransferase involved in cell wall biosynthesis
MEALVRENPDGLDLLLVLNPFEVWADYRPPIRPLDGPPVAAVIYDLIPCLFQEVYLARPEEARRYYRQLQTVRGYDRLLAISEATRADCLRVMGLDQRRVITVAPAADDLGFVRDGTEPRRAAGLAYDALTSLDNRRAGRARRPRVALFAPLPPRVCGEADHALRLAGALKATYAVDLFHESGYGPEVPDDFPCYDHRLFRRFAASRSYHGVLYHMGNTYQEQRFVYESLRRCPGVVTLHDFCLSGFFWEWSRRADARSWPTAFLEEVRHFAPDLPGALAPTIALWHGEPGGIPEACARRGIYLNRRIFEHAAHVIVHSRWCLERAHCLFPEHAERVSLIPLGAALGDRSAAQRTAIRNRFGVPVDALVFGSFGILGRGKMNEEAVQAFAQVAHEFPRAEFLFVGPDFGQGAAREAADALGLGDRVRILGRLADTDYDDLIAITDVGVNLRRPPTYGETSGSLLDLLRFGVAAVVTDIGSFSELPDGIVRKVRWSADGLAALTAAFRELSRDPTLRVRMGRAARQYIQQSHAWSRIGALYTEVIERSLARARPRESPDCPSTGVLHPAARAGIAPRACSTQEGGPR